MRKSSTSSGTRAARAGLVVASVATVLVGFAAVPAFAVGAVAIDDATGFTGGGDTVELTSTAQFGTGANGVTFSIGASCPAKYTTTGANIAATPVTHNDASSVEVDVPTSVVPGVYKVCVYVGAVAGTSLLANSPATLPIYTVAAAQPVLSPATGVTGGGTSITATLTDYLTTATTPAAVFSIAACPSTYGTPTANLATTVTKTSVDVGTLTVPAGVVIPNTYNVCVYAGALSASVLLGESSAVYTPTPPTATLSAVTGPTGGGNTITATSTLPFLNGVTTPGVTFSTSTCPATYTAASMVATATRVTDLQASIVVPSGVVAATPAAAYHVCIYTGTSDGVSTLAGTEAATYSAAYPVVTLSTNTGTTATVTPITVTGPTDLFNGYATPASTLSPTACNATYTASTGAGAIAAGSTTRIALNKAVISVPVGVTTAAGPAYNVCVYTGTGAGTLLANSGTLKYTVGAAVTATTVTPAAGPSLGGNRITVAGTGLPTTAGSITATLGGFPLVVTPGTSTAFTAIVPAHDASGALPIKVVTSSGTVFSSGTYTFLNGVTVSPNTVETGGSPTFVDVMGVGFAALDFTTTTGTTSTDANGHVYLVDGAYDATDDGGGLKETPPQAECTSVLRISDNELVCTVTPAGSLTTAGVAAAANPIDEGTYTLTVVSNGNIGVETPADPNEDLTFTKSVVSSTSTFTVAAF
jgi:hypothetical protein